MSNAMPLFTIDLTKEDYDKLDQLNGAAVEVQDRAAQREALQKLDSYVARVCGRAGYVMPYKHNWNYYLQRRGTRHLEVFDLENPDKPYSAEIEL